jgi:environmental stress-induced protein Ves
LTSALPAGLLRFALADLPPEPWRNGGGLTRTVAAVHVGAALRWRVSAADITQDGPFSVFDGVDRQAVLMRGPGLVLHGPANRWTFPALGDQQVFAGEMAVGAQLGAGPARLWNVMVARGQWRAEVQVHQQTHARLDPTRCGVLVVLAGQLQVGRTNEPALLTLGAEEGLVLVDVAEPLQLQALAPQTHWIHTTLYAC